MTPPGASLDAKDGITSTSATSLREQAFPPSTRWPPRQWPWRPGNAFTPTDGGGGARNPVGDFVFPIPRRPMRSITPVAYPLGRETFACHAISVWNRCV
ncbi:Hypothetical protein FKW44_004011 [Caligus rogercresseyi]|uniref:Uncharacterized protein n=1 Tax=Caligus rogercresseyi TaxID=217165 RepID=A0A7T8HLA8_CALRO|nr:Hypothetical protein FKW44_004011 [Caligus rogercresseyi]